MSSLINFNKISFNCKMTGNNSAIVYLNQRKIFLGKKKYSGCNKFIKFIQISYATVKSLKTVQTYKYLCEY